MTPTPSTSTETVSDAVQAMPDSGGLAIGLVVFMAGLLVASAAASGSETALFGLTHGERVALRRQSPKAAGIIDDLLGKPRRLLICVLLLNMVVNVLYFAAAALLLQTTRSPLMGVLAALLPLVAIILFGEILAKLAADTFRTHWARLAAPLLLSVSLALGGLLMAIDSLMVAPLSRLVRPSPGDAPHHDHSDVRTLIRAGAHGGTIDDHEQELLEGVVGLSAVRARVAMTPRLDLHSVTPQMPIDELVQYAHRAGNHRLPVFDEHGVTITRILDVKATLAEGKPVLDMPIYVPENARLDRVLNQLRERKARTAVCVDEHGESTGMLGFADLLRGLVGMPIEQGQTGADGIIMVGLGCWSAPGRMPVSELARLFTEHRTQDFGLPPEAVTIAGAVMASLGRLAEVGDSVDFGPVHVEVERVAGRTIERVLVRPVAQPMPAPEDQP
ncbi:MAG: CNNM domain-containing protein [Phycisphaera sp.]|nr:MAG: CNNM domain-containing protein [Phycisphaera sp.]